MGTHHRRAGWWVFGCSALAASTARGRRCGFSCRPALRALRSNCRAAPPVATTLVASEISPRPRVLALTRLDKTGVIGRRRGARPARKRAFCAVLSFPCTHSSRRTATAGFAAVRLRRSPARLLRGRRGRGSLAGTRPALRRLSFGFFGAVASSTAPVCAPVCSLAAFPLVGVGRHAHVACMHPGTRGVRRSRWRPVEFSEEVARTACAAFATSLLLFLVSKLFARVLMISRSVDLRLGGFDSFFSRQKSAHFDPPPPCVVSNTADRHASPSRTERTSPSETELHVPRV